MWGVWGGDNNLGMMFWTASNPYSSCPGLRYHCSSSSLSCQRANAGGGKREHSSRGQAARGFVDLCNQAFQHTQTQQFLSMNCNAVTQHEGTPSTHSKIGPSKSPCSLRQGWAILTGLRLSVQPRLAAPRGSMTLPCIAHLLYSGSLSKNLSVRQEGR